MLSKSVAPVCGLQSDLHTYSEASDSKNVPGPALGEESPVHLRLVVHLSSHYPVI